MRSLSYVILTTCMLSIAQTAWAGPESGQGLLNPSVKTDSIVSNASVALPSLASLDEALALPAFADAKVDAQLETTEHPMIPLPGPAIVGLIMLAGIAARVVRPQRASRLR